MADAPKLLENENLRTGFPKINQAIDNANEAIKKAQAADTKANSVQEQFNQVVIEGDSSLEAAQARVKADGTSFTTLQERLNDTDKQSADARTIQDMTKKMEFQIIRQNYTAKLTAIVIPVGFTWQNAPIKIFYDGKSFKTFFDMSKFKNTGGITYYIDSVRGLNTNSGLTKDQAFQNMNKVLSVAVDGDTVVIMDELLSRTSLGLGALSFTNHLNIVANTKTTIKGGDTHTFIKTSGYTNVWETSRTNTLRVVDFPKKYDFTQVTNISECDATPGSWYTDGTKVYIHTLESQAPQDDKHFVLINTSNFITINAASRDVKVYFENIEIVGGASSIVTTNSATTKPSIYMKNGGAYFSCGTSMGAIYAAGCEHAFFQNVEVAYSWEDGFDYHLLNGTATKFIEVDCKAHSNGRFNQTVDNFNGSTAHNDCKGVRFGGHYHRNIGPNIADVQGVVQTVNYNVKSFDSASTQGVNFAFQISDGEMWLFNCTTFGCVADLYCPTGGTMHVDKDTVYFTKGGLGNLNISS